MVTAENRGDVAAQLLAAGRVCDGSVGGVDASSGVAVAIGGVLVAVSVLVLVAVTTNAGVRAGSLPNAP